LNASQSSAGLSPQKSEQARYEEPRTEQRAERSEPRWTTAHEESKRIEHEEPHQLVSSSLFRTGSNSNSSQHNPIHTNTNTSINRSSHSDTRGLQTASQQQQQQQQQMTASPRLSRSQSRLLTDSLSQTPRASLMPFERTLVLFMPDLLDAERMHYYRKASDEGLTLLIDKPVRLQMQVAYVFSLSLSLSLSLSVTSARLTNLSLSSSLPFPQGAREYFLGRENDPAFAGLVVRLASGPCHVAVLAGRGALTACQSLIAAAAPPLDVAGYPAVFASADILHANREIAFFFVPEVRVCMYVCVCVSLHI
jgi:nucleoside diphosphate kinase